MPSPLFRFFDMATEKRPKLATQRGVLLRIGNFLWPQRQSGKNSRAELGIRQQEGGCGRSDSKEPLCLRIRSLGVLRGFDIHWVALLPCEPMGEDCENMLDLFFGERLAARDLVPFLQTTATARGRGVLGYKDRMTAHRRLSAIVFRLGRR